MSEPSDPRQTPPSPPPGGLGFELPPPARLSRGRALGLAGACVVVLSGAFALGWLPRLHARAALEQGARAAGDAALRVEVVTPKLAASDRALSLPASVQSLQETVVYSRADGYVRRWLVDMGDRVAEGQLLAELDTPEVDRQLEQARAQLAQAQAAILQARANRDYSRTTYERYRTLTMQGLSAPADLDQRKAQADVDQANVTVAQASASAADANVRHLAQLKAFAKVTAPFAGTVTARMIEVGALVTAGSATPMFRVAASNPARVFVRVPQDVAPGVHAGIAARVTVREYPGRTFDGKVSRAAGELDPATRTMNTEVRVPNDDGALLSGMYAQVALTLATPHRVLEIPATALMSDAGGQRVAVVDGEGHLHLVTVVVERDNGATLDVASGLTGGERVVRIGSPELTEGRAVTVAAAAP